MKQLVFIILILPLFINAVEPNNCDFLHDIYPLLEQTGCNSASCHGNRLGAGGLRFSLFGQGADLDYIALCKASGARRINIIEVQKGLLFQKICGESTHSGTKFSKGSKNYNLILAWLEQGANYDTQPNKKLESIEVIPAKIRLKVGEKIAVQIMANYSNGKREDVSDTAHFIMPKSDIISCTGNNITALKFGECYLAVRFQRQFATCQITIAQHLKQKFPVSKSDTTIDRLVNNKLKKLGFVPSELCSDEQFIRRLYLDVTGTIPTVSVVKKFLADKSKDKRKKLINKLLNSDLHIDYLTEKWCDLLRCKAEYPSNLWPNAVQAYQRWINTCIKENKPFDQFARELLLATGSNFRSPEVNYYRAFQKRTPQRLAESTAMIFMGMRYECARCHAHPMCELDEEDSRRLAAFFAQVSYKRTKEWKEEIVYLNYDKQMLRLQNKQAITPAVPKQGVLSVPMGDDAREVFANWLTKPDNPYFAKCIVNRIWFWLLGRGIIQEPDDIRTTNPPSNPALLAFLEQQLVDNKYDIKHIFRIILNSNTYQRSSKCNKWNRDDNENFSRYYLKRLQAEQLCDAISFITGIPDEYSSRVPEPFTFLPRGYRATDIADGSITSPFLELFGRPSRDTSFEADRDNSLNQKQVMHFLNSDHLINKIDRSPTIKALSKTKLTEPELITQIYLLILSRYPNQIEQKRIEQYFAENKLNRYDKIKDLIWALLNTKEFMYNH